MSRISPDSAKEQALVVEYLESQEGEYWSRNRHYHPTAGDNVWARYQWGYSGSTTSFGFFSLKEDYHASCDGDWAEQRVVYRPLADNTWFDGATDSFWFDGAMIAAGLPDTAEPFLSPSPDLSNGWPSRLHV